MTCMFLLGTLLFEVVGNVVGAAATSGRDESTPAHLRGTHHGNLHYAYNILYSGGAMQEDELVGDDAYQQDVHFLSHQSLEKLRLLNQEDGEITFIISSLPLAFQISMSIILAIVAIGQLALLAAFIFHRSRRVLEFAQPLYICILIGAGVISTGACYLFLYISDVGCALREPIIFLSFTLMGATIAGRAWRISILMRNPLTTSTDTKSKIESCRQLILIAISALSVCDMNALGFKPFGRRGNAGGRPIRVKITFIQMMRATLLLCIPQIALQVVVMGVPGLRSMKQISYFDSFGVTIAHDECRSLAAWSWPTYVGVLFAILPCGCAYLLNLRPKKDVEGLPSIIDERGQLNRALAIFVRVLVITLPITFMTDYYYSPAIRTYCYICEVLGLSLSLSYHIGLVKLAYLRSNVAQTITQYNSSTVGQGRGRSSAAYAVKMAQMYATIGRTEDTLELIDDTLASWKKGSGGGILGTQDATEDIGCGFTKADLKNLEIDELEMIIQLLVIKGDTLMRIHGLSGFPLSAEINISAMKIFEHCPAAKKMKDVSVMFPIYNRVGLQLKGGIIAQDEASSLEMDLAEKFCHEAQVQSYHFVRALSNLAEWYGRMGEIEIALACFDKMAAIYMPIEHPPLIYAAYAVNRCAVTFAVSCLWFLQKGETEKAIQRCEQVIKEILPSFDKKDMIGMYHIFWPIIRVLKWNGLADKAREFYNYWAPPGIESHFAMGRLHKPMCLLLKICDGSSVDYSTEELAADIDMVLSFDVPDMDNLILICDGWSVKTMAAELCLHLARRLEPGKISRESLIERGLQMSTMATASATTSNGMIKHILAYDAHKGIDDRLLDLRKDDNVVSRRIIYDQNERTTRTHVKIEGSLIGPITSSGAENDFASRFNVKGKTSSGTGSSPSFDESSRKARVTFSKSSKQSNGSAPKKASSRKSSHSDHSVGEEMMSKNTYYSPNPALD